MSATVTPRVAVAIACYNQARFLDDALRSVVAQHTPADQVIVVDDGSTDDTPRVAHQWRERHPVEYIRQSNQGLSAARNTGWQAARSELVVFLDADDMLLPCALEAGVAALQRYPSAAFVSGRYKMIDEVNRPLELWRELRETDLDHYTSTGLLQRITADGRESRIRWGRAATYNHHQAMLRWNYIGMHGTVMYQRWALEAVGGFNTSLTCCEDYDMYLRITHRYPVACHEEVVALYRRHSGGMSRDIGRMLRTALEVLELNRPAPTAPPEDWASYRAGRRFWKRYFAKQFVSDVARRAGAGQWGQAARGCSSLLKLACGIEPTSGVSRSGVPGGEADG